jgi:hypothetical protein
MSRECSVITSTVFKIMLFIVTVGVNVVHIVSHDCVLSGWSVQRRRLNIDKHYVAFMQSL